MSLSLPFDAAGMPMWNEDQPVAAVPTRGLQTARVSEPTHVRTREMRPITDQFISMLLGIVQQTRPYSESSCIQFFASRLKFICHPRSNPQLSLSARKSGRQKISLHWETYWIDLFHYIQKSPHKKSLVSHLLYRFMVFSIFMYRRI
jgi:hypothetical protein